MVGLDAGDPLHDVEVAWRGFQAEVRSLPEVVRVGGIEGELAGIEVIEADVAGLDAGEQGGEAIEVAGSPDGTMSRSFDGRITPKTLTAKPPMST